VVARSIGRSVPDTIAALVQLELRGLVTGTGGRYRRTFGAPSGGDRHPP